MVDRSGAESTGHRTHSTGTGSSRGTGAPYSRSSRPLALKALPPPAEDAAELVGAGGARGGGAGGRGGGARGGRGANAGPVDPIAAFTTAIDRAPTIGYIWTNEVTGYAIKHALRLPSSDGDDRIILATNRRIGANALSWTPTSGTPTAYEFTLVEIRLPSRRIGRSKDLSDHEYRARRQYPNDRVGKLCRHSVVAGQRQTSAVTPPGRRRRRRFRRTVAPQRKRAPEGGPGNPLAGNRMPSPKEGIC